jgi:hypothetical protein
VIGFYHDKKTQRFYGSQKYQSGQACGIAWDKQVHLVQMDEWSEYAFPGVSEHNRERVEKLQIRRVA